MRLRLSVNESCHAVRLRRGALLVFTLIHVCFEV